MIIKTIDYFKCPNISSISNFFPVYFKHNFLSNYIIKEWWIRGCIDNLQLNRLRITKLSMFVEKCKIAWIRSSLCVVINWMVSLYILVRRFCERSSGYSFSISSKRNSSLNSMNFFRIIFS
ncbi:hypothetical protein AAHE18_01G122700 [Arachis hypogaea]